MLTCASPCLRAMAQLSQPLTNTKVTFTKSEAEHHTQLSTVRGHPAWRKMPAELMLSAVSDSIPEQRWRGGEVCASHQEAQLKHGNPSLITRQKPRGQKLCLPLTSALERSTVQTRTHLKELYLRCVQPPQLPAGSDTAIC